MQHVRVLIRVQTDVHRHHGHATLHGGQDGLQPLEAVREQHADAVARGRPQRGQGMGQAVDPRLSLTKRDDLLHIPSDLVVDHWPPAVESSLPLDFPSVHAMWTLFGHLIGYKIMSIISESCDFTTKSGGI